jgi:hypothetical protein
LQLSQQLFHQVLIYSVFFLSFFLKGFTLFYFAVLLHLLTLQDLFYFAVLYQVLPKNNNNNNNEFFLLGVFLGSKFLLFSSFLTCPFFLLSCSSFLFVPTEREVREKPIEMERNRELERRGVRWASHRLGRTTAPPGGSQPNASEAKKLGVPAFSRYRNSRKFSFFG